MSKSLSSVRLCKYHRLCLKAAAAAAWWPKLWSYLSFQAAAAGATLHLEAVLLEAGGGRPGRRLGPGLFFRSGRGLLLREAGQGRVAAAAHVERHICVTRTIQVVKKEENSNTLAVIAKKISDVDSNTSNISRGIINTLIGCRGNSEERVNKMFKCGEKKKHWAFWILEPFVISKAGFTTKMIPDVEHLVLTHTEQRYYMPPSLKHFLISLLCEIIFSDSFFYLLHSFYPSLSLVSALLLFSSVSPVFSQDFTSTTRSHLSTGSS